jgi:hypothetical protein
MPFSRTASSWSGGAIAVRESLLARGRIRRVALEIADRLRADPRWRKVCAAQSKQLVDVAGCEYLSRTNRVMTD